MYKNGNKATWRDSAKTNLVFTCIVFLLFATYTHAQQASPQLLKQPANWQFERFALPPVFAPSFPYKGAEELRFSPGMFHKDSLRYFTYAFVAQLDNTTTMSQEDIRNYLLLYFKGLCSSTARDRKLSIDTAAITVSVEKKKQGAVTDHIFNALVNIPDVFTDGARVSVNMQIKVLKDSAAKRIYLVFIASPKEKRHPVWQELYTIQQDFTIPAGK